MRVGMLLATLERLGVREACVLGWPGPGPGPLGGPAADLLWPKRASGSDTSKLR